MHNTIFNDSINYKIIQGGSTMYFFKCLHTTTPQEVGIYLHEDDWDDFGYKTTFGIRYFDGSSVISLGRAKIAFPYIKGEFSRSNIPESFEKLGDTFFSLGETEHYYDKIRNLPVNIRTSIYEGLRDMAFDLTLFDQYEVEEICQTSLLRSISSKTVRGQLHRMAHGGSKHNRFEFGYKNSQNDSETNISFEVIPESLPPTNIHVIIGRNGVGKTRLIKNIVNDFANNTNKHFILKPQDNATSSFTNLLCVAFSAFDEFEEFGFITNPEFKFIGLTNENTTSRIQTLTTKFVDNLFECLLIPSKKDLLNNAFATLNYDPIFQESKISTINLDDGRTAFNESASHLFKLLSSGHKIILLTLIELINQVQEKSLVLLDEPETHLHPPLISSFIRALSDILIQKNGVALITTHSPIILQEVPKNCVYSMRRYGSEVVFERPEYETFGRGISSLTNEVFGLEIQKTGFYKFIVDQVQKNNYNYTNTIDTFENNLSEESISLIATLIALKEREGANE